MKNSILSLVVLFLFASCGDDTTDTGMGGGDGDGDCGGALTATLDGTSISNDKPEQAFLAFNDILEAHELGIIWVKNGENVNLQLVLDLGGADCIESKRYDLSSLSSNVNVLSIQYASLQKQASVSNIFFEDGDTAFIEISNCDGADETIDVSFGFTTTSSSGVQTNFSGMSEDICFTRTK